MILDSFLRFLTDLAWLIAILAAAISGAKMGRRLAERIADSRLVRRWRGRRARAVRRAAPSPVLHPVPEPEVAWSASLLVRTCDTMLHPAVQVFGGPFEGEARVRLELVDDRGRAHARGGRRLTPSMLGTEIHFPPFRPLDGRPAEEAMADLWRVVVELDGRNRLLLAERPRFMGGLTAEAEIGSGAGFDVGPQESFPG